MYTIREENDLFNSVGECFDGKSLDLVALVSLACFLSACQAMQIGKDSVMGIVAETIDGVYKEVTH